MFLHAFLKGYLKIQFLDLQLQSQKKLWTISDFFHRKDLFPPCTLQYKFFKMSMRVLGQKGGTSNAPPPGQFRVNNVKLILHELNPSFQANLRTMIAMPLKSLNQISMFTILKNGYFQLWFLYKSVLRICTARKHNGMIKIKHF